MRRMHAIALAAVLLSVGCRGEGVAPAPKAASISAAVGAWVVTAGPSLPVSTANNAVVAMAVDGRDFVFSFLGLGTGRDARAITRAAWALDVEAGAWASLPDVPGPMGRLAATAQAVGDRIYLIGGYTVAEDATEVSVPNVDIYEPLSRRYTRGAPMPVPVDDTVSGVWRGRLIYLVSGWSMKDNVNAVQFYDPAADRWTAATPIPGTPVFGHAGGIVDDVIVYCGGAKVQAPKAPKYAPSAECWRGDIDRADPRTVAWRRVPHHPGPPRYRAASGAVQGDGVSGVMFVGGTDNPYNYNGVGYDGGPSEPLAESWIYDVAKDAWQVGPVSPSPGMDHRGLVSLGRTSWTVGGFTAGQAVSAQVLRFGLPDDDVARGGR